MWNLKINKNIHWLNRRIIRKQLDIMPTYHDWQIVSDFGLIWRTFREYLQINNFFQKSGCHFSTFIAP